MRARGYTFSDSTGKEHMRSLMSEATTISGGLTAGSSLMFQLSDFVYSTNKHTPK
jgi:hypothetical protein